MFRALLTAFVFALVACGGDDESSVPVTGEPSGLVQEGAGGADADASQDPAEVEDELIAAVEAYARTVIEGDPEAAVDVISEACAEVRTELDAPTTAGDVADGATVSDVEAEVDGDEATVNYRLDPDGEQVSGERWVREDGEWKWDNC